MLNSETQLRQTDIFLDLDVLVLQRPPEALHLGVVPAIFATVSSSRNASSATRLLNLLSYVFFISRPFRVSLIYRSLYTDSSYPAFGVNRTHLLAPKTNFTVNFLGNLYQFIFERVFVC